MQTVNPELREVQQQVADVRDRLSKAEGEIQQINRSNSNAVRQTIWQFVIFTASMAGILIGMLNYQTSSLRNEMGVRFDAIDHKITQLEKRLDQRMDSFEKRMDSFEKRMDSLEKRMDSLADNLNDLRKEVRNRK